MQAECLADIVRRHVGQETLLFLGGRKRGVAVDKANQGM